MKKILIKLAITIIVFFNSACSVQQQTAPRQMLNYEIPTNNVKKNTSATVPTDLHSQHINSETSSTGPRVTQ